MSFKDQPEPADEDFDNDDIQEMFSCKYCKYGTPNVEDLDEHIITHEEALLEELDEDTTSGDELLNDASSDPEEDPDLTNSCSPTNESLANGTKQDELPAYYQKYAGSKNKMVFVCPYCGYQTMMYLDLHRHLNDHSKPLYACSECTYTTIRKQDINRHLRIHCDATEELYKCEQCPYETCRKYDLNRHLLCHENNVGIAKDNSQFNCSECGYKSKRLSDLHRHVILHCDRTVTGAFKCTKCDYATTVGSTFAKHVLSYCKAREKPVDILDESRIEENV